LARDTWRSLKSISQEARFPAVEGLDSFDLLALPSLDEVLAFARAEYVLRRENGTGKSHVARRLGVGGMPEGLSVGRPLWSTSCARLATRSVFRGCSASLPPTSSW